MRETGVVDAAVQGLASHLRGELIRPGDAGYDAARKVYNGMIDKRPALIARCVGRGRRDRAASTSPASRSCSLAVRGGGHNGPGLGICDDGLVIDLSRHEGHPGRSGGAHRAGRGRRASGATWTTPPTLRPGDAERLRLDHRRGRPDAGRRHRLPARTYGLTIDNLLGGGHGAGRRPASSRPAPTRTRISSGRCAAAAATSASSPRSCSGCTRSAPSTAGRSSGRWRRPPRCCRFWRDFILKAPEDINGWFALRHRAAGAAVPEPSTT